MAGLTLGQMADTFSLTLVGDPDHHISGISSLQEASEHELSLVEDPRYLKQMIDSQAGAFLLKQGMEPSVAGRNYLFVDNPTRALEQLIPQLVPQKTTSFHGVHPLACVDPEAVLGQGVTVGPYAVIEARAHIGANSYIAPFAHVGPDVQIGCDVVIHSHVVLGHDTHVGDRVILQPGVVLGACGFGYTQDAQGRSTKLTHIGRVCVESDVEIGANTTVDRARFTQTLIGQGTKIDNLVQIGHNVTTGKHCIFVSQVGIAGSVKLGNHVVLGGKAGINGHIRLADGVRVGGCSAVLKSITEPGDYLGTPAEPARYFFRKVALLSKLARDVKLISQLEAMITSWNRFKSRSFWGKISFFLRS